VEKSRFNRDRDRDRKDWVQRFCIQLKQSEVFPLSFSVTVSIEAKYLYPIFSVLTEVYANFKFNCDLNWPYDIRYTFKTGEIYVFNLSH